MAYKKEKSKRKLSKLIRGPIAIPGKFSKRPEITRLRNISPKKTNLKQREFSLFKNITQKESILIFNSYSVPL